MKNRMQRRAFQAPRGLTLAEVVVSTFLTAFVLIAALQSLAGTTMAWRSSDQLHDGMGLAQQLMAEILQQRYREGGISNLLGIDLPELSLDRSSWDDVDDYHGMDCQPQDKYGNSLEGYSAWRTAVTVDFVQALSPQNTSVSDEGLKRVTVTVTDPKGRRTILVAYRSLFGVLEQAPTADATLQAGVVSEIQINASTKLQNGVSLSNHARDR